MRLLVFGSRSWIDVQPGSTLEEAQRQLRRGHAIKGPLYRAIYQAVSDTMRIDGWVTLIEGEAVGADLLAREAAWHLEQRVERFPVTKSLDGDWPAAGHRRNARMHRDGKPDRAIGFISGKVGSPMSKGSAGMLAICRRAGTPVIVYREDGVEA